jgi:tetratricopeptide (TPR) repeat protein
MKPMMTDTSVEPSPDDNPTPADPLALERTAQDALEKGNLPLAELAFLKLSLQQPSASVFARVYEVASARRNLDLAQRALEVLIDFEPNNARALERLAELRGRTGDNTGAVDALRRALIIEPRNATLATWFAIWSQGSLESFHDVPDLLNNAVKLDEDGSQLEQIVDVMIYQQRYQDAEHTIGIFQEKTGSLHPRMLRYLGVALAGQSRQEEAAEVFAVAIESCHSALPDESPSPSQWRSMDESEFQRQCELYAFRARLEHEAGLSSSAQGTYAILHNAAQHRGLAYPAMPVPDTATRLSELRHLIAGRDMVLLCQGHSLQEFSSRIGELGARNPALASLNRFGVIEHDVLAPAGRGLDVVVEVTPGSVKRNLKHLKQFLRKPKKTMAFVSTNALVAAFDTEERDAFITYNGPRLIAANGNGLHSVTPYDPLGIIQANTLLAAIPLLIAAQPKRIFVIGADQRVPDDQTSSHFSSGSKNFEARAGSDFVALGHDQQQRENYDTTMRHDAAICDRDLAFQIAAVATLHGFAPPPVFNVSPNSRLQSLPKLSLDDFFKMVD